jgi:pimeloyl-ACP methyl ester carboxylesterase
LTDGTVHYEIAGPSTGQVIVLVHGFSVPYYIWDPTFKALVKAGFQALRYDLYGRGYSDRPDTIYDKDLFDRQLEELLSVLEIKELVDVVGLSMGGAISAEFVARHPRIVRRLCLIDPVGLPMKQSFTTRLVKLPMIGEWVMSLLGDKVLLAGQENDFQEAEELAEYLQRYREQMQYVGFKRALLSTIRSGIVTGATEAYERVGRLEHSVMLIWGREDMDAPFELNEKIRKLIPQIEFQPIDEAGHLPHYERPEVVNPLLVEFLIK